MLPLFHYLQSIVKVNITVNKHKDTHLYRLQQSLNKQQILTAPVLKFLTTKKIVRTTQSQSQKNTTPKSSVQILTEVRVSSLTRSTCDTVIHKHRLSQILKLVAYADSV